RAPSACATLKSWPRLCSPRCPFWSCSSYSSARSCRALPAPASKASDDMARATINPGRLIGRAALGAVLALVALSNMAAAAGDVDHGDIHVHDPMMVKQGRTYYVFSTGG